MPNNTAKKELTVDEILSKKQSIREKHIKLRSNLSADERATAIWQAANYYRELIAIEAPDVISFYSPFNDEIDFTDFAAEIKRLGYGVALPRILRRDFPLVFNKWTPGERLENDALGIPCATGEEVVPNMFTIPLIAVDRKGNRIGYGGGYFDRTIERLPKDCIKVGLCYSFQVIDDVPIEAHDQPMDYIVTEKELIKCR